MKSEIKKQGAIQRMILFLAGNIFLMSFLVVFICFIFVATTFYFYLYLPLNKEHESQRDLPRIEKESHESVKEEWKRRGELKEEDSLRNIFSHVEEIP